MNTNVQEVYKSLMDSEDVFFSLKELDLKDKEFAVDLFKEAALDYAEPVSLNWHDKVVNVLGELGEHLTAVADDEDTNPILVKFNNLKKVMQANPPAEVGFTTESYILANEELKDLIKDAGVISDKDVEDKFVNSEVKSNTFLWDIFKDNEGVFTEEQAMELCIAGNIFNHVTLAE